MKKNLSKAMAAALTVGAVAPMVAPVVANAAEVSTKAIVVGDKTKTLNVRAINGQKLVTTNGTIKVHTRSEAFNTNFTEDVKDDTLKNSDAVVVKEFAGTDKKNLTDYKYILAEKATTEEMNLAKAELEVLKAEIAKYQVEKDQYDKAYKIEEKDATDFTVAGADTNKQVIVKDSKDVVVMTYNFQGVKYEASTTDSVDSLRKLFDDLRVDAGKTTYSTIDLAKTLSTKSVEYYQANKAKYIIEKNVAKFDIVKTELKGTDLKVELYKKGAKKEAANLVFTFEFKNVKTMDKDAVVNVPLKADFTGHWAEDAIVEAMLNGHVDASTTFRPKDGITRAEFVKMVNTMFNIDMEDEDVKYLDEPFTDVKSADWFYNGIVALYNTKSVNSATKGTIIGGYADETFRPKAKITRQEAAKMIAAAYEIKGKGALYVPLNADDTNDSKNNITSVNTNATDGIVDTVIKVNGQEVHRDIKTKFKDDAQIGAWADEAVRALSEKLVKGSTTDYILGGNPDGTFKPQAEISRVEALLMLQRASVK